ncbi:PucC family protein, partial [Rhodovulum sulfidophilum]|uniref:PucC family protein n=1 Tax=Rhodovulum sulfidophilum TaxID=35806 RepID=UPI001F3CCBF0
SQATSAGAGIALGGVFRDAVLHSPIGDLFGAATPYFFVYAIELALLVATIVVGYRLMLSRAFGIENAPD